jgi:hypothetical protein
VLEEEEEYAMKRPQYNTDVPNVDLIRIESEINF